MKLEDIERLERLGLAQVGKEISTPIALLPGELLALCSMARDGLPPGPDEQVPVEASASA